MDMVLGLNLSFAVKRWMKPEELARMCREDFKVSLVQFTFDLINPWWPEAQRDKMANAYRDAFAAQGIAIDAAFGGLASYSYAQFLSPFKEQREIALLLKRGIDMTRALGADIMGTPVGGMDYEDARDPTRREALYREMLDSLCELAAYGKEKGLREIHIEATPLITEFPHSPAVSVQMMKDLDGSAIPIKLLIDWGHALYRPLLKEEADIDLWFRVCAPYIGSIHLQQCDGLLDRHWDFTKEGIITPELILSATEKAGLSGVPQYLEVVTIFEQDDDEIYQGMKTTMDYLHDKLGV